MDWISFLPFFQGVAAVESWWRGKYTGFLFSLFSAGHAHNESDMRDKTTVKKGDGGKQKTTRDDRKTRISDKIKNIMWGTTFFP
jgi:hypothetical protein